MYGQCVFEYMWVNIRCMLDWIIGFGHKTAEIHFFGMSVQLVSVQNEMAGGDELSKNSKPLVGLAFDDTTW